MKCPIVETPDSILLGRAAGEELARRHPDWSVDTLLVHPAEAIELCRAIRLRLGKRISDSQILQSLLNARKRSILPTHKERL